MNEKYELKKYDYVVKNQVDIPAWFLHGFIINRYHAFALHSRINICAYSYNLDHLLLQIKRKQVK